MAVIWLAVFLIVDKKMSGFDALKVGLSASWQNLFSLILAEVLMALFMFAGFMLCVIPGYLLLPIVFATHFIEYRCIFPRESAIVEKPIM